MTIQTQIIAAMVHRSGLVPWMCNEIAQRMGGDHSNNTIGNYMQSLLADGLVVTVPLPQRGGVVAWQLTPRGAESVDKPAHRVRAEAAKPKCGGLQDVARIMAAEGVGHQDAYRLSIMDTDPAYHSGNRLPGAMELQQAHAEVRRAKARAKVLNGIRQGDLSTRACQMLAGISYSAARKAVEELAYAGLIEALPQTHLGIAYRITDTGRNCP